MFKTKDHIIPKSRGGNNAPNNLIPCCQECNLFKGDLSPEHFLIRIQLYIQNKQVFKNLKLADLGIILVNTRKLIETIKDRRYELLKKGLTGEIGCNPASVGQADKKNPPDNLQTSITKLPVWTKEDTSQLKIPLQPEQPREKGRPDKRTASIPEPPAWTEEAFNRFRESQEGDFFHYR